MGSGGGAGNTNTPSTSPEYHFIRVIGRGGFCDVWEALHVPLGRVVAIKRLRARCRDASDPDELYKEQLRELRFRQEALTAASLEHPNIVPVHDLSTDQEGRPLLVMKRAYGEIWQSVIVRDWDRLSYRDYYAKHILILIDVVQAVSFAHSRGIIHRDLKPNQVMVGNYGEVLLMDWGLAVVYDRHAVQKAESPLQYPSIIPSTDSAENPAGTMAYMAPEQTGREGGRLGPWTDVYLLGGILYYLLTCKPPHDADTGEQAFAMAAAGRIRDPKEVAPNRPMPEDLLNLCLKSLSRDPKDRPQNATEFLDSLRRYVASRADWDSVAHRSPVPHTAPGVGVTAPAAGRAAANARRSVRAIGNLLGAGQLAAAKAAAHRLPAGAGRRRALALIQKHARATAARRRAERQRLLIVAAAMMLLGLLLGATLLS